MKVKKLLEIIFCEYDGYYDRAVDSGYICKLSERRIIDESDKKGDIPIPDWCLLPDYGQEEKSKVTILIIEEPKETIHFYKGFREPIYAPNNELIGFRTYNKYYIWDFEKFIKYYKYNPDLGCMVWREG